MVKRNQDYGRYEFNRNWITNHPVATQNLLGMGMFEQTFHRLVGDFNDQVTYNNKKLEKIFNGKNLIMTHNIDYVLLFSDGKPKEYFWSVEGIEPNQENIIRYSNLHAMIGNMLQVLRIKYMLVRLERKYRNSQTFIIRIVIPIRAKNGVHYFEIPIEFMDIGMQPQLENSIKVLCGTYQHYDYRRLYALKNRHDYIFVFYDEKNRKLPLFIHNAENFKGNSYFLSNRFNKLLLNNIREEDLLSKEEVEKLKEECRGIYPAGDLPFVLPYDARLGAELRKLLVKKNPEDALVYFNGYTEERDYIQIYNNLKSNLRASNDLYIETALQKPSDINLMLADQVAEREGMGCGMSDCLIMAANKAMHGLGKKNDLV